jgi:hypothetical protein
MKKKERKVGKERHSQQEDKTTNEQETRDKRQKQRLLG